MDFILAAAGAAITNIGLLAVIITTYINFRNRNIEQLHRQCDRQADKEIGWTL